MIMHYIQKGQMAVEGWRGRHSVENSDGLDTRGQFYRFSRLMADMLVEPYNLKIRG